MRQAQTCTTLCELETFPGRSELMHHYPGSHHPTAAEHTQDTVGVQQYLDMGVQKLLAPHGQSREGHGRWWFHGLPAPGCPCVRAAGEASLTPRTWPTSAKVAWLKRCGSLNCSESVPYSANPMAQGSPLTIGAATCSVGFPRTIRTCCARGSRPPRVLNRGLDAVPGPFFFRRGLADVSTSSESRSSAGNASVGTLP